MSRSRMAPLAGVPFALALVAVVGLTLALGSAEARRTANEWAGGWHGLQKYGEISEGLSNCWDWCPVKATFKQSGNRVTGLMDLWNASWDRTTTPPCETVTIEGTVSSSGLVLKGTFTQTGGNCGGTEHGAFTLTRAAAVPGVSLKAGGSMTGDLNREISLTRDDLPTTTATTTTTSKPNRDPLVGLWKSGSLVYRWVAISGGYEQQVTTPVKLKNGCLIRAGESMRRYIWNGVKGSKLYRVTDRYWAVKAGGPGSDGLNCSTVWKARAGTVRIDRVLNHLTVSCANTPNKVCVTFTRVPG